MRQSTFVIYNKDTEYIAKSLANKYFFDGCIFSDSMTVTEETLKEIISKPGLTNFFYIVRPDFEFIFDNFKFDYVPPEWDKKYVHLWNKESNVRLYYKESVIENVKYYTDTNLFSGKIDIKNITGKTYTMPVHDIVYLSFDEAYADENYNKLKERFPRAKRVHGIKGFFNAHYAAAKLAETDMVYIVDADADVVPTFTFDYYPRGSESHSVHVWHSKNPVNDLEYGYGGVKLFPTKLMLSYKGSPVDFTTSVSSSFKVMEEVSNITRFNTDPFSAWRSGFRECTKLASGTIHNQNNDETNRRLQIWCTVGNDREFGDFTIMGANEGREFGLKFANQPEMLELINDYKWLEEKFSNG